MGFSGRGDGRGVDGGLVGRGGGGGPGGGGDVGFSLCTTSRLSLGGGGRWCGLRCFCCCGRGRLNFFERVVFNLIFGKLILIFLIFLGLLLFFFPDLCRVFCRTI